MSFFFVVNPRAGVGELHEFERLVKTHAQRHQCEFDIAYTQARGHAADITRKAVAEKFTTIVAVGGDGTINEVAQGLMDAPATLGIVPRGSGNGLARHLNIPIDTPAAIEALFTCEPIAMDVFTVNDKLSLNVSGLGFDGHVTRLFGVDGGRGLLGYVSVAVQEFLKFREFTAEIAIGPTTIQRTAFIIAVANSSQYGNNARIAPSASVCDGILNVTILKKIPLYRMDFLYDFFAGNVGNSPYSEIIDASALTINTLSPVPYHVDGEPAGHDHQFRISILPGALRVLHPRHMSC